MIKSKKKKKKNKDNELRDLWNTIRHIIILIMGIRREERDGAEKNIGWKLPKFNDKTTMYTSAKLNILQVR